MDEIEMYTYMMNSSLKVTNGFWEHTHQHFLHDQVVVIVEIRLLPYVLVQIELLAFSIPLPCREPEDAQLEGSCIIHLKKKLFSCLF